MSHYHDPEDLKLIPELKKLAPDVAWDGYLAKVGFPGITAINVAEPDFVKAFDAMSRRVKIAITPLPGPEVIAGSTRLKAGTATKLVLNMLTTASFIRAGHVWRNLMVNVQPKNSKLMDRAKRIISSATGAPYDDAGRLLAQAGNNVRKAIEQWEAAHAGKG